jgi:hypothetical protein
LFVIDSGKCFRPPPRDTVLKNGDYTAKGFLYPAGYRTPVESPFCNTIFLGGGDPKLFPASITNTKKCGRFQISSDKKKMKLSRYTPWRHMGGEEV